MLNRKLITLAIASLISVCATPSQATALDTKVIDQTLMREASEGPRGADHERPGDHHRRNRGGRHGLSVDAMSFTLAREASEAPRGADNNNHRRGRGRLSTDNASSLILAREAAKAPRGADKLHPRGHGLVADEAFVIAREAGEAPRGADNNNHRRGRGGLSTDNASSLILAREASEGPRGADNERPGDRQRRGSRNA